MNLARMARLARKPPRYLARRIAEEAKREAQIVPVFIAARRRGPWPRARLRRMPREQVLEATAAAVTEMAPWPAAIDRTRNDDHLRAEVEARARLAREGMVELFGDGPLHVGVPPDWHADAHGVHRWKPGFYRRLNAADFGRDSDVKVPWELSRLRQCVALAQSVAVDRNAESLAALSAELTDWRAQNPVGWSVNWTVGMEVALRAVNLICIDGLLVACRAGAELRPLLVGSLYQHGWFLSRNLEISDVNGNHFLANAVGLVWLGRYFRGIGEADTWFERGVRMTLEASREQVLGDGLDHEGSLPYHVLVLEMFLLAHVAGGDAVADGRAALGALIDAAVQFVDASGRVPNLGDDDGGRVTAFCDAPSRDARRVLGLAASLTRDEPAAAVAGSAWPHDAIWLTGRVPQAVAADGPRVRPRLFADGGLAILGGGADHVAVDCGPIGFRGRGGHGHVDALSFEAVLGGVLAVRDSGTATYTRDPAMRDRLRSARAHNVVIVDGVPYASPSTESLWQLLGDSPPQVVSLESTGDEQSVALVQELPAEAGRARVERTIRWRPGTLELHDRIDAPPGAQVEQLLQLPPGCAEVSGGVRSDAFDYRADLPPVAELTLELAEWSERYGSVGQATRAVVRAACPDHGLDLKWRVVVR